MELDEGESEVIALALQLKADLLLLDEQQGRILASRFGLKSVGHLGILIEAKNKDLIPSVKAVLDHLIVKAGFWVSHKLYKSLPHAAGE